MCNLVYAVLARRADETDAVEYAMFPHVDQTVRDELQGHRDALDALLAAPMGRDAEAERALVTYLGGVA